MSSEWATTTLGEITDWSSGGTPSKGNPNYWGGDIPWISASSMKTPLLCASDLMITKEGLENGSRLAPVESILLLVRGSELHKRIPVGIATRPVAFNQDVKSIRAHPSVLPRFIFYWLKGNEPMLLAKVEHTGIGAGKLDTNILKNLLVKLPPISEQKAISDFLGSLDDKIELNRKTIETLEAMARAIFKSWFIDFDPVHAKSKGHKPDGMDAETAKLFPSSFEDSELGMVPKGWKVGAVRDIGSVVCGKTPPTAVSDNYGSDIPFITIPDMHGNVFAVSTGRKLSIIGAESQANKTLPTGSICVSCIATPGLVVITTESSQTNQQINSLILHQNDEIYFWYWVMKGLGAEIASSGSGGSVLSNLSKGRFELLRILNPPHPLICSYHHAVSPLFERILENTHQSHSLAELRDALLPKLLSGEITVPTSKASQ